jgi:hypothetical protein
MTQREKIEEMLDDAFYEAMQALNSGAKQGYNAWPKVDEIKKAAKRQIETLITENELEVVKYWHKRTIKEAPHPSHISNTLHAQEERIATLQASLKGKEV